jgi:hypothetical protein
MMALVTAPGRSVLLFGGLYSDPSGSSTNLGDTWTWDGATWTERHPFVSPSPRYGSGVAFDASGHVVVLFGGCDGYSEFADTWTWSGAEWVQQHPASSPPSGCGMGMAYDEARGQVVLFGGYGNGGTWTWDGTTWTEQHPDLLPHGREWMGMASDRARKVVVVYGGEYPCFDWSCYLHDTWVWDGTTWRKQRPDTNPPEGSQLGLAFDSARGVTVQFGGAGCCSFYGKTWTWGGTDWTQQHPSTRPDPRQAMGMTWDGSRRQVLLFGGRDTLGGFYRDFADTWAWDGSTWSCLAGCG